jgi:hypothetical protein
MGTARVEFGISADWVNVYMDWVARHEQYESLITLLSNQYFS